MMHEAVDYNALSWVRHEIDATLSQARAVLAEYSDDNERVDLLNDYTELLHQVRGPLQIAELEGADLLVAEMESVVAGLHGKDRTRHEKTLEILLQSMQVLPAYLSRLQSSADDAPERVHPQVNLLRSLERDLDDASTDFVMANHAALPAGVYSGRETGSASDITSRARSARVRFQSALLEWYRGVSGSKGTAALADVLGNLQEAAGSESEARFWWVSAGVAEALNAGLLQDSREIKQLFGQIDRQIKRLVENGDVDFDDAQTQVLLGDLLNCIAGIQADEGRLAAIHAACSPGRVDPDQEYSSMPAGQADSNAGLQNIDIMNSDIFATVDADCVRQDDSINQTQGPETDTHFQEILRGFSLCKDAIEEYLESSGADGPLQPVPEILNGVCSGLMSAGLDREADVIASVQAFIKCEMLESVQIPEEDLLKQLADAICSVEFYLECLRDGRIFGSRIIESAEIIVAALGFPVRNQGETVTDRIRADEEHGPADKMPGETAMSSHAATVVSALQVIDPDADKEILEVFFDESDTELHTLRELVSRLDTGTVSGELLEEISRVLHTLKGNGRMLGAFALGEFAYLVENLVNNTMNGDVNADSGFVNLLKQACEAMFQLVEQTKDAASFPDMNIDELASEAIRLSLGDATGTPAAARASDAVGLAASVAAENMPGNVCAELPVLAADTDPEIVEIFIDEAVEEIAVLAESIPAWIADPEDADRIAEIRRSMHTLKGSGRMAGALRMGEFAWTMEDLLNRVIDGTIVPDDNLCSLVNKLPAVLQQLTEQIRDGTETVTDVSALMTEAAGFRRSVSDASTTDETASNEMHDSGIATEYEISAPEQESALSQSSPEPECSLLQIYTRECQDILDTILKYLDDDSECGMVTEPLYRGLHTLAGISESAEIGPVGMLASELDRYFSNLYHVQGKMPSSAADVLRDSSAVIALMLEKMPDASSEAGLVEALRERISALHLEDGQAADTDPAESETCLAEPQGLTHDNVPAPVESDGDDDVTQADDFAGVDQELFEVFLEEAAEIQDASERALHAWAAAPENHDSLEEYQRHLHTLKGSARMMNITAIGDLSHSLETVLTRVVENTVNPSASLFSALFVAQDQLTEMLEQVRQQRMPGACTDLEITLAQLLQFPSTESDTDAGSGRSEHIESIGYTDGSEGDVNIETAGDTVDTVATGVEDEEFDPVESSPISESVEESPLPYDSLLLTLDQAALQEQADPLPVISDAGQKPVEREECSIPLRPSDNKWPARKQQPARKRGELVKVESELLNDLVNYSGEINIYRSRMEAQIGDYRFNLGELEQTISRLREQLRKLEMETEAQVLYRYSQEADRNNQEFDPLELDRYSTLQESSRSLMESISDLYSLLSLMENTTRDSETLLLQQSRVSTDLHEGLMRTRMTPFAGLETRLKRIVRQSARQLDKKVELELQGADGEMDRAVIERIIAPLEHMLRNAVAHGVEHPGERVSRGKDETGRIAVAFDREGPDIVLRITDDGAGMNMDAIRAKAVERGLLEPGAEISDSDVTQFVLQTGFTTASEVTQISGRGVGLDVVNSEVKQLGGSLDIASTRGTGTIFTIRLPYTLAINQVLLVQAGTDTYCVPLGNVEGVVRVHPEELLACYEAHEPVYEYAGNQYQLKHLATLLNTDQLDTNQMSARVPLLLMRVVDKRIALHVESLLGSREIVIKPVGMQLSGIDGISGATILGDGSVAMILDVFALSRSNARAQLPVMRLVSRDEKRLVVMVVDDSITVRKVTTRLLERNGYKVLTAKDGVDATAQLQGCTPDFMLLDIEMPRMDGFELATHMRNDERLRHVPVIMITSRTGDKHRERARQIGVKYYLGKPYQENDLLGTIDRIIRVDPGSSSMNFAEA